MVFDLEDGRMQCGMLLEHIHGDVRLFGQTHREGFASRGEIGVDSLIYRGAQLTQLKGPFLLDQSGIILGTAAERGRTDQPPRSLTARVFGGQLSVDAGVRFAGDAPFNMQARIDQGDLAAFAQEWDLKNQNIRGRANALLNLNGNRYGSHSWRGKGFVRLYEANIYEVPVMLALLKLLSIREPDTTAFTSSDIDFRLQGEDVYLDRINFNGDVVSLKGHGEMNLDRRIKLKFYALVGRSEFNLAALRSLLRQASQQILLIHVTGTLDAPRVSSEALPMLKETLDQIFPETAGRQSSGAGGPATSGRDRPNSRWRR
jgi:hypothetical protein